MPLFLWVSIKRTLLNNLGLGNPTTLPLHPHPSSLDLSTKGDTEAELRGWGSVLAPLMAAGMQLMDQHVPDFSLGGSC